jgi:hypothetical protein
MTEVDTPIRWTSLDPTPDQIARLRSHQHRGRAFMLNLLKFRDQTPDQSMSGRHSYRLYSNAVEPMIERACGQVVFVGRADHVAIGDVEADDFHLVSTVSGAVIIGATPTRSA